MRGTRPGVPVPPSALMRALPLLDADDDIAATVALHLREDPLAEQRRDLVGHYLGDTSPGAATAHFIAACEQVMATRDREWARLKDLGAVGP